MTWVIVCKSPMIIVITRTSSLAGSGFSQIGEKRLIGTGERQNNNAACLQIQLPLHTDPATQSLCVFLSQFSGCVKVPLVLTHVRS